MKNINSMISISIVILMCGITIPCFGTSKATLDQISNEMITKDPEKHATRIVIAFHYFDEGYFKDAEKHFKKASELTPKDPYDQIWLFMAQLRQDPKTSTQSLKSFIAKNKSSDFIYTDINLLLGAITPEDAIKKAIASGDPGNVCEAYYYAAQRFLADGNTQMAKKCFKKSIETKKETFWEYKSSVAGLKVLD